MSNRLRYAALALLLALPTAASAQSPSEKAAALNEEGKTLWLKQNNLEAAVDKFRQATDLSPEARYIFNLCYALHQLGQIREALTECEKVATADGVDDKLRKKSSVVIQDLNNQLASAPSDPYPDNTDDPGDPNTTNPGGDPNNPGGDPNNPNYDSNNPNPGGDPNNPNPGGDPNNPNPGYDPNQGGPGTTGGGQWRGPVRRPIPGLYQPAEIPDDYRWALGVDFGFHGSNIGTQNHTGAGAKIKGYINFMWLPDLRVGAQFYLGFSQITAEDSLVVDAIQIVDAGAALYKHIKRNRFYFTPLIGAHATAMSSSGDIAEESAGTVGLRADTAVSWLLGPDRRHVLSVTPGFNLYLPANGADRVVVDNNLDEAGLSFFVTVGYALRFTTPFGQSSLITLE